MKATLRLEFIGASTYDYCCDTERTMTALGVKLDPQDRMRGGPWVAEMRRNDEGIVRPTWIYGRRDYSQANSKGTRFVYVHYILEDDRLYWVQEPKSWRSTIRYFAAVTAAGDVRHLSDEEAQEWLSAI